MLVNKHEALLTEDIQIHVQYMFSVKILKNNFQIGEGKTNLRQRNKYPIVLNECLLTCLTR